uniref:Uncharacterized protein n=1 Tax=Toxoplasma gondii COUG TaxID=1074873 RepID=A0A2G8XXY2_TOXGO|nr:hypothetical protein TGCOUG_393960 [Toxoplasma gondii COUG]
MEPLRREASGTVGEAIAAATRISQPRYLFSPIPESPVPDTSEVLSGRRNDKLTEDCPNSQKCFFPFCRLYLKYPPLPGGCSSLLKFVALHSAKENWQPHS